MPSDGVKTLPMGGLAADRGVPRPVGRRQLAHKPHKLRMCRDGRNYVFIPFTIQGTLVATDYGPMWRCDRDYWIARITANVGRHDDDTHPNDGTPSGTSIRCNLRRVTADLTGDAGILGNDTRLHIAENHHQDVANDDEEGPLIKNDFQLTRLKAGQHVYPRVSLVGSGRPGNALVITLVLVPVP